MNVAASRIRSVGAERDLHGKHLQDDPRAAHRSLWADEHPVAPWEWRGPHDKVTHMPSHQVGLPNTR